MIGGFGVCGIPENLINALNRRVSENTILASDGVTHTESCWNLSLFVTREAGN